MIFHSNFYIQRFVQLVFGRQHDDDGQATTEYALILLVAAVIALLVLAWATAGGGAGKIGSLFDTVFTDIFDRASTPTP